MKIYTRTGDAGQTGLFGGARLRKDDALVEAYGTIDELNAQLGLARALGPGSDIDQALHRLQTDLFALGAEVACVPDKISSLPTALLGEEEIKALENLIDEHEESLPPLKNFILPSGSPAGSALHVARTVARRAERRCIGLPDLRPTVIVYLNRLSDCLFVLARSENHRSGVAEFPWTPRGKK